MAANVAFEDFDSPAVYKRSLARAQEGSTHNFVVGFGQKQAKIAFNVSAESFQELLEAEPPHDCPVRWMYAPSLSLSCRVVSFRFNHLLSNIEIYGVHICRRTLLMR
jgi:hypothetical protein